MLPHHKVPRHSILIAIARTKNVSQSRDLPKSRDNDIIKALPLYPASHNVFHKNVYTEFEHSQSIPYGGRTLGLLLAVYNHPCGCL